MSQNYLYFSVQCCHTSVACHRCWAHSWSWSVSVSVSAWLQSQVSHWSTVYHGHPCSHPPPHPSDCGPSSWLSCSIWNNENKVLKTSLDELPTNHTMTPTIFLWQCILISPYQCSVRAELCLLCDALLGGCWWIRSLSWCHISKAEAAGNGHQGYLFCCGLTGLLNVFEELLMFLMMMTWSDIIRIIITQTSSSTTRFSASTRHFTILTITTFVTDRCL